MLITHAAVVPTASDITPLLEPVERIAATSTMYPMTRKTRRRGRPVAHMIISEMKK